MQSNNNLKQSTAHLILLVTVLFMSACAVQQPHNSQPGQHRTHEQQLTPSTRPLVTVPPPVIPAEPPPAPAIVETVWDALRVNKQIPHQANNIRIQHQLQRYLNEPDYIPLVMDRAEPFLYHILEALQQREMPSELALLPVIESAYHSNARSRNGAGGLWQIMPITARELGLKQSWLYDGRDDVIQSTQAALNYLQMLNNRFNGDWLLTMAAYNAGFTTVYKATQANLRAGLPTDYWSLRLPAETMNYVPRFFAIVSLIDHSDHFGIQLPATPYKPGFERVAVSKAISLKELARRSSIDPVLLSKLNPAFRQGVTPGKRQFELLTPVAKVELVKQKIETLPVATVYPEQHTIQRGETLSHISRRYGVSIAALRQANQLKSSRIHTGKRIIIPRRSRDATQTTGNMHIVRSGETLWGIAQRYRMTVNQLARLNAISIETTLHPGRALVIREG